MVCLYKTFGSNLTTFRSSSRMDEISDCLAAADNIRCAGRKQSVGTGMNV